jgi:hypothetical protein
MYLFIVGAVIEYVLVIEGPKYYLGAPWAPSTHPGGGTGFLAPKV